MVLTPAAHEVGVERIVLTGFMGSGKTTVGRLLAARLNWNFADLDREIEAQARKSVPRIFAEDGEARFRQWEHDLLHGLLRRQHLVLALGGGAPEFRPSVALLRSSVSTVVVHLSARFETLAMRCAEENLKPGAIARPLFADPAAAQERFDRRAALYAEVAHHAVSTNERSVDEVAKAIVAMLA